LVEDLIDDFFLLKFSDCESNEKEVTNNDDSKFVDDFYVR